MIEWSKALLPLDPGTKSPCPWLQVSENPTLTLLHCAPSHQAKRDHGYLGGILGMPIWPTTLTRPLSGQQGCQNSLTKWFKPTSRARADFSRSSLLKLEFECMSTGEHANPMLREVVDEVECTVWVPPHT